MAYTNTTSIFDNFTDKLDNCTNEYCVKDEDYFRMIQDYIFPTPYEWVLIFMHSVVFVIGFIGNILVGVAVYRNHSMQTVTNYFIVNLAIADLMVILICLPPTVLWDVTETWFLGSISCKMVVYVQTVSVSVSVLTLTFISVDRWYAICYPLKFTSTTARAKSAILLIWAISLIIACPELVALEAFPKGLPVETILLTDCRLSWDIDKQMTYQLVLTAILYCAPFLLMSVAYYQIIRVLWRDNIPGAAEAKPNSVEISGRKSLMGGPNSTSHGQIRARRKAAKMLIVVVVMFGICYSPVHIMNVLRYTTGVGNNHYTVITSILSHLLCYANSAINPLIYNFMSGKFRREFKRAFLCVCGVTPTRHRSTMTTVSHFHVYTTR